MAQIKVITSYRGVSTKEQIIEPGVYDEDDPRLHGLAQFLVDSERAFWTQPKPEATPAKETEATNEATETDDIDYSEFTVSELQEIAELRGINVEGTGAQGRVLKTDLLDALEGGE